MEPVCPPECSVPSYNPLEFLEAQTLPSRRQARPRGAGRALGADSCGLPNPTLPGTPSPGPPRRPRCRAHAASRCRYSPAGRSQESRASPQRHSAFRARQVHRPTRAPERGPLPIWDCPLSHLAMTVATMAGLRERLGGEKEERGLLGRTRGPRRKLLEATNSPSFLFSSRAVGSDRAQGVSW